MGWKYKKLETKQKEPKPKRKKKKIEKNRPDPAWQPYFMSFPMPAHKYGVTKKRA
jgi:hypothetical protein